MKRPTIELLHGSNSEAATRDVLLELFDKYDLSRWCFTDRVVIDEDCVVTHSHPVLTLHCGHRHAPTFQMAVYLHEQLHWFMMMIPLSARLSLYGELLLTYQNPPVGGPAGAQNAFSSILHYAVCDLEYSSLISLIGSDEARQVISRIPFYTEIYATVLRDHGHIEGILDRHGLSY